MSKTIMIPFKTTAHINSLKGEIDEITVLEETEMRNQKVYIVDYKGKKCTAIFNWFVCAYYADDIYGIIKEN